MPDWKSFVRDHIQLNELLPARQLEIIEDVAQQLEDVYQEALRNGLTESQAKATAEQHIPDWQWFSNEVSRSQPRSRASQNLIEHSHSEKAGLRAMLYELMRDLIYGARMLRKNPRFTIIVVLTIALGISATTAIFSVVNAVILKPLPYDHPEQILWVWGKFSQGDRAAISPPDFLDYRARAKSFEKFAAMHVMHQFVPAPMTLNTSAGPVKIDSALVTAGFFEVFGARPHAGRTFVAADEQQDTSAVILSYSAWQEHFVGDPQIIGKSIVINQSGYTVVGVMQKGFGYPLDVDLWSPLVFASPDMQQRKFHFLRPIVRVREGMSIETAQAELQTIAAQLEKQYPESNRTWRTRLETLQEQMVGNLRRPLFVIFAAVSFLLLIACVNVANLLLARAASRQKEIAIRVALGAGRFRVMMQLLAEGLLISIPSGLLGLLLAHWSLEAFRTAGPDFLPRLQEVSVDRTTLLFTLLSSVVTGILFSIAPAIDIMPHLTSERLKEGKYSGTRTAGGRLRQMLAVCEIALSLILLAGAGLLLKSFWNLTHVDLGFQPENLLTMRTSLDEKRYPTPESVVRFVEAAMQKLGSLPGVDSVAAGSGIPLIPAGGDRFFTIEGRPAPAQDADKPNAQFRAVTKDYFKTLSVPVMRGRSFGDQDHETSAKVVIVNEPFVKKFFTGGDAIGKRIDIDVGTPFLAEIVGIVKGTRQNLVNPPDPEMYVLHKQAPMGYFLVAVRSPGASVSAQTVRSALQELDKEVAFQRFRTMNEVKAQAAIRNRLNATLLAGAAAIALLLAAVGIYGVLSFSVEQRHQEIGVRLALGAQRLDILALILRYGIRLAAIGLVMGITGALLLTRLMQTLLFEVSPNDPLILAAVSFLLALVAIVACLVPALRATRIDPLLTLRYE